MKKLSDDALYLILQYLPNSSLTPWNKLQIPDGLLTEGRIRWVQLSYQMHLNDPNENPSTVLDFNP